MKSLCLVFVKRSAAYCDPNDSIDTCVLRPCHKLSRASRSSLSRFPQVSPIWKDGKSSLKSHRTRARTFELSTVTHTTPVYTHSVSNFNGIPRAVQRPGRQLDASRARTNQKNFAAAPSTSLLQHTNNKPRGWSGGTMVSPTYIRKALRAGVLVTTSKRQGPTVGESRTNHVDSRH